MKSTTKMRKRKSRGILGKTVEKSERQKGRLNDREGKIGAKKGEVKEKKRNTNEK